MDETEAADLSAVLHELPRLRKEAQELRALAAKLEEHLVPSLCQDSTLGLASSGSNT